MPAQNSGQWRRKSNRGLIIGLFGFCFGIFGIVYGMFWEDIFNWIKHKVIQVYGCSCIRLTPIKAKPGRLKSSRAVGSNEPPQLMHTCRDFQLMAIGI